MHQLLWAPHGWGIPARLSAAVTLFTDLFLPVSFRGIVLSSC